MKGSNIKARFNSTKGATLVECALLMCFIAVVCIIPVSNLGQRVNSAMEETGGSMTSMGVDESDRPGGGGGGGPRGGRSGTSTSRARASTTFF